MKKILRLAINLVTFSLVFSCALFCSAQARADARRSVTGGSANVSLIDKEVVAAANFAVNYRRKTEKTASLKLISIERARKSLGQAGTHYLLCLKISDANKEQEGNAQVYEIEYKYEFEKWTPEKCSPPEPTSP